MDIDQRPMFQNQRNRSYSPSRRHYTPRVHLIGSRTDLPPPLYPRDDSNISKRATPKSKGARPCRHCGSDLHWDNECKHSTKRTARVRLCESSTNDLAAEDEYLDLFESLLSEDEQGFENALQPTEPTDTIAYQDSGSALEGSNASDEETPTSTTLSEPKSDPETVTARTQKASTDTIPAVKHPLNRRSRR